MHSFISNVWAGFGPALAGFLISGIATAQNAAEDEPQQPVPEALPAHRLTLRNSDAIGGRFLAFIPGETLSWETDKAVAPLAFPASSPLKVDLESDDPGIHRPPPAAVQLRNGDQIPGSVDALDGETLQLSTEFAGGLDLARADLRQIEFFQEDSLHYIGPEGIEDWVPSSTPSAWSFRDGALVAQQAGSISREIHVPDRARILLDLSWDQNLYMSLSLFADDPKSGLGTGAYSLVCQYANFHLLRGVAPPEFRRPGPHAVAPRANLQLRQQLEMFHNQNEGQPAKMIGMQVEHGEFYQKRQVRLELFLERKKREISLALDGKVFHTWTDPDGFDGKGRNIVLRHFGHTPRTSVHRIEVTDWNGILPGGDPSEEKPQSSDLVFLRNSDVIAGDVLSLRDNRLLCRTDFAELPIPMNRVQRLVFRDSAEVAATDPRFDTRAFFRRGGSVTVRMLRAGARDAVIEGPYFSERPFLLAGLSAFHFDVHNELLWKQDESGFWNPEQPNFGRTTPSEPVSGPALLQFPFEHLDLDRLLQLNGAIHFEGQIHFERQIQFDGAGGLILVE